MWSMIWQKIKEIFYSMIGGRTIEKELHVTPAISSKMELAIKEWSAMYEGNPPWVHEPSINDPDRVVSLGLPSLIASEKARTALLEFKSDISAPTEEVEEKNPDYKDPEKDIFGNLIPSSQPKTIKIDKPIGSTNRAEYLNNQYQTKLLRKLRTQLEYGIAKGGLIIKPYVVQSEITQDGKSTIKAEIEFDYIQADAFFPLACNASGKITEAAFVQTKYEKDVVYRRLEYHKWENNRVTVVNKAFKSTSDRVIADELDLGHEVPLSSVYEWKDLPPQTTIDNVNQPLFAYFKMPEANIIDTNSFLGISGFARARDLIKDADIQYSRLLWEYEGGEMAIDVDRDALRPELDAQGRPKTVLPVRQQRLFRKVADIDFTGTNPMYEQFAPALRDDNYIRGLNTILMRIEDVCGISRGTLSEVDTSEARTATELKILRQRSYQTNADIQTALEDCLKEVVYIMNVYCDLYNITESGEYDVSFEWDDSIIVDVDTELLNRITLMQNGLSSKLENRMWYFGETQRQAEAALLRIDEENKQSLENNLIQTTNEARNEMSLNNAMRVNSALVKDDSFKEGND